MSRSMRTCQKNKQKMFYALYAKSEIVYELDENGNKIVDYVDSEGNEYYRESGTNRDIYHTPVEFYASISGNLNEVQAREYGLDQTSIYSKLCTTKGLLPAELSFGTKIWKNNEIKWLDSAQTIPDPDTADYTIKGILDEFLGHDWFLLQRNNS